MCAPSQGAMLPYGLKIPSPYFPFGPSGGLTQAHLSALDFQRSQLNDYNVRVQFGLRNYQNSLGLSPFHAYITDPYTQAYFYKHDPRARFVQEEPKPSHSYIGLIGMAILNAKEKKLVLSDIYQWILDNYAYFRTRGPGWRNSIRHNLSLNDCFIKSGRSANGKGHYWAVHPANVDDFERGDFRRRRAQRKVRRHMGLSVPDDDDSPSPSPTQPWPHHDLNHDSDRGHLDPLTTAGEHSLRTMPPGADSDHLLLSQPTPAYGPVPVHPRKPSKKRQFDMASLLAPDDDDDEGEENMNTDEQTQNNTLHCQQLHESRFAFHPLHDLTSHVKSSVKSRIDNNGSNPTHELTVDVDSPSSSSRKELMSYDSEDDHDNDEIQVTSGENSPAQTLTDNFCDTRHDESLTGHYINANGEPRSTEVQIATENGDADSSHVAASLEESEPKSENALDLSSPPLSKVEKKPDNIFARQNEESKKLAGKPGCRRLMPGDDDDCAQAQTTGTYGSSLVKSEPDPSACNGHNDSRTAGDRCVSSKPSSSDQDKRVDSDSVISKSSYRDIVMNGRCDPRAEMLLPTSNGCRENSVRGTDRFQFFHQDAQELRTSHLQWSGEPAKDISIPETERHVDTRAVPNEGSFTLSDPSRAVSEHMRWTDLSKNAISRDRMSAFSTLGVRNHNLFSPFQTRNFSVSPQRLLPSATPLRAGIPTSLLYVSSPSPSTGLVKGIDTTKCTSSNSTSSSTTNNGPITPGLRATNRD